MHIWVLWMWMRMAVSLGGGTDRGEVKYIPTVY